MKKLLYVTGGIILLIIIVVTVDNGGNEPEKIGEVPINNKEFTTEQLQQTETKVYNLGDRVKLENKVLTAYSIANYIEPNKYLQPKAGNKHITVDISLENDGPDSISYNVLNFRLQDSDGYVYTHVAASKEPYFTSGALQPGRKIRGFIVYEIPQDSSGFELIFTPGWGASNQIIIDLSK